MLTTLALSLAFLPLVPPQQPAQGSFGSIDPRPVDGPRLDVLHFDNLPTGRVPSELFGRFGAGPVLVQGTNPDFGGANAALVFDSDAPTGGDPDLGSPNEDFGGPGVGAGGGAVSPFANRAPLRKVLVVADDLTDANNDGLVDDPGDSAEQGTALTFDFSPVGGARLDALTVIDAESINGPATVELFDDAAQSLGVFEIPTVGDNGVAQVRLGKTPGVMMMEVVLNGSAAIDNIVFLPFTGTTLRGRIWDDQNGNGLQDPDEPGMPNVEVLLENGAPGPEASVFTNNQGVYRLQGLAPGTYSVTVAESSLPSNAVPSPCDVGTDDSIDSDCLPASFEATFATTVIDLDFGFSLINECDGTIGDLVFFDADGDNVQGPADFGLEGVTVELFDAATGLFLDSVVTDENGNYSFNGVCEGEYAVGIDNSTLPPGIGPAVCDVGNDTTIDSECGPECVMIFESDNFTEGTAELTIDWGFRDCGDCSGKIDGLSLLFTGQGPAFVEIVQSMGQVAFADVVETGDILSFFGSDNQNTLGPEIDIFVNGQFAGSIHTSCSKPIFIGLVEGDFEVRAGSSRNGGTLCPETEEG